MKKTPLAMLVTIALIVLPRTMSADEVSAATSEQRRFKPGEALEAIRTNCPIRLARAGYAVYVRKNGRITEVVTIRKDDNGSWSEHPVHKGFSADSGMFALEKELLPAANEDTWTDSAPASSESAENTLAGLNTKGISWDAAMEILRRSYDAGD